MSAQGLLAAVPEATLADLKRRYADPQRRYHTWTHIEALLGWFDEVESQLRQPCAVFYAILFHDAVYDPLGQDNETRSARLLAEADVPLSRDDRDRAVALIEATFGHRLPASGGGDAALFLDMDLSILGAPPAVFDRYEDDVRAEYAAVPEPAFRAGRRRVLQSFAARERLYFSDWGRATFEGAARANLARSLARLEASA